MPMVRDYSTSGGHAAGDEVIEGASKTVTKKWQGYPPENLNVIGKPLPPLPEVSIPRFTGKAQYASRVWFPDLLYVALPHVAASARAYQGHRHVGRREDAWRAAHPHLQERAEARSVPTWRADRILPEPLPRELNLQGEAVAIVVR